MSRLILFDDDVAAGWRPFTWTRPAGELVVGACSFRERAERLTGMDCVGHIAPHVAGFDESDAAPAIDDATVPADEPRLYLSSRFVPDWDVRFEGPGAAVLYHCDGEPVGVGLPPGAPGMPPAFFRNPASSAPALRRVDLAGRLLSGVWELVTGQGRQLALDMDRLAGPGTDFVQPGVTVLGEGLRVDRRVTVEPGVVLDCTTGPIWLEDEVTVRAFTRLAGPARIGPGSTLLGGTFDGVTIGPRCKVRGEVESTVILGYSNKAHDGFLGHAVIGRWVNLGAMTTNSDLKNNYGNVRISTPHGEVDTGSMKVGCFIGDHVKTAIGTMLNTGTVVGPGSNIFGGMPEKMVPPFSWGGRDGMTHALDRFLDTAATVMQRRGVELTEGTRLILERAWRTSRGPAL